MEKEFVKYETALALKELGFDEPCFSVYIASQLFVTSDTVYNSADIPICKAPTFSQAFRWFREKYNIQGYIYSSTVRGNTEKTKQFIGYIWNIKGIDTPFLSTDARDELHDTYEEAESACLDKLIEIIKNK